MTKILNLKGQYKFKCSCGFESEEVSPSIFMMAFQANRGAVHCPECKRIIPVKIDEKNESLVESADLSFSELPDACYRDATEEEEKKIQDRKNR